LHREGSLGDLISPIRSKNKLFGQEMKLLISIFVVVSAIAFCGSGRAEETEINPFSVDAPAPEPPSNPDHLEPIPAYDPDGYDQAVFRSLLGNQRAELWMIGKPSFSPEYVVILRHIQKFAESDDGFDRTVESEKWVVEYVEAKKQIWRWKDLEGGMMELDIKVTKDLNRKSTEVSKEFAHIMHSAWESVLKKTRYPDADYRGLDGATYQFYSDYGLFGEIWTPFTGTPRMITDLGHKLGEVAKADKKDRDRLLEECLKLAKELRTRTIKPEQDGAGQPVTAPELKRDGNEKPKPESEGRSQ